MLNLGNAVFSFAAVNSIQSRLKYGLSIRILSTWSPAVIAGTVVVTVSKFFQSPVFGTMILAISLSSTRMEKNVLSLGDETRAVMSSESFLETFTV